MKVILFGATGMVGRGVLLEALDAPDVERVLAVGRSPVDVTHPKLEQLVAKDLAALEAVRAQLAGHDACFFCLGVSSAGMSEPEYARITYDLTIAAVRVVLEANPGIVLTYVSGQGTDSTEKGRSMWARVKGRTENALLAMPWGAAYMFRPGFIRPERGVTSRTKLYRAVYAVLKPFGAMLARSSWATTTTRMGQAMLHVAATRPALRILETRDINAMADARRKARGER